MLPASGVLNDTRPQTDQPKSSPGCDVPKRWKLLIYSLGRGHGDLQEQAPASILRSQVSWRQNASSAFGTNRILEKKGDEFLPDSDGEISIKSLLVDSQRWDGIDDYLRSMQPPIEHKGQWGGWAESFCVAWMMRVKVLCFLKNSDDSLSLACEAYGHPRPRYQLCLLWSGGHYDVLTLNPIDLEAFLNAP